MSALDPAFEPERLLAHADWVRRLARSLVRDPERAADVEQESWLEALRRPPRHGADPRAWLARVVRSAAARSFRSDARRTHRERAAARGEALASTDEVVLEAERQRELVGRVLALDEALRDVLLLRYFRGLSIDAIAERLGRPRDTVRARLRRGLERLRSTLDAEHGGRERWHAWIAVLALPDGAAPLAVTAGVGSLVMGSKLGVALAATTVLAVLVGVWSARAGRTEPEAAGPRGTELAALADGEARADEVPPPVEVRAPLAPLPVPETSQAAPTFLLRGRTVDLRARPFPGVGVRWSGAGVVPETRSDAAGLFELVLPDAAREEPVRLDVTDAGLAPVGAGRVDGELWLIVAPAVPLRGRVVDPAGRPLAGASVRVIVNPMALRDFTRTPDWEQGQFWSRTTSDARGEFLLERVPLVEDRREADTFVTLSGYEAGHPPLPRHAGEYVEVVLEPLEQERPRTVSGHVLAPGGAPVEGAAVYYGRDQITSGADGAFELPVTEVYVPMSLIAVHPGHTPAVLEAFGDLFADSEGDFEGLVLVLGPAPLAIEGRLVDADGEPARGWRVTLQDGTSLGAAGDWAEHHAHGTSSDGVGVPVGDDGGFSLGGLSPRAYTLRAWNPATGALRLHGPIQAGASGLVLAPDGPVLERLEGLAVDRAGRGLADLEVRVEYKPVPSYLAGWERAPARARTDEHGRFVLDGVSRVEAYLVFEGEHVVSSPREIPPHRVGEPVRVEVPMLTRFRVELAADDPADAFQALDEDGVPLRLSEYHSFGSIVRSRVERGEEGFPVCVTSGEVAELLLLRDGVELRRVPLALDTGGVHVVRP